MKNSIILVISFSAFPILFLFSQNSDVISLTDLVTTLIVTSIITFIGWAILSKVLKNQRKSGIIIVIMTILFFSYGHVLESFVFEIDKASGGHKHLFLLSIYGIFFIITSVKIWRTKEKLDNVEKIVCGIGITLCILAISSVDYSNYNSVQNYDEKISNIGSTVEKRNIYYILFDGYSSSEILEEVYGHDNSQVVDFLKDEGFFIAENSYTNYPQTQLFLSALLNMEYINYLADEVGDKSKNFKVLGNKIYESKIITDFRDGGYGIYYLDTGFLAYPTKMKSDMNLCTYNNYFNSQFQILILRMSMFNPIYHEFFEEDYRQRILCTFEEIPKIHEYSEKPVFVFAHIMVPHAPYIFGPNGEDMSSESFEMESSGKDKEGYLNQAKFAEKTIVELVKKIRASDKQAIIMIMSDSGSDSTLDWNNPNDESIRERFGNFNTYYFPDGGNEILYDGMSPVNTFRKLLNFYFNEDYEILEDRSYFSNASEPFNFIEVTDILN